MIPALVEVLTRAPRVPRALERPRITQLLGDGEEPGRLVVAPPGSGKTVAAAQLLAAAAAAGRRTGWCRLARGAAGGSDLVELVAVALGVAGVEPGGGSLEHAAVLLDVLGDQPTTVVVDDYDLGRPEECDPILAEVLALAGPECRLVVCSATRPAGLVGRASVGQLRFVGPADLAFDVAEVGQLLELYGRDPAPASRLHTAAGGWPAAVAVLAESSGDASADALAGAVDALVERAFRSGGGGSGGGGSGGDGDGDGATSDLLAALALVPSLGLHELAAAGLDPERLRELIEATALLRPVGDRWALLDVARAPVRRRVDPRRWDAVAARVAPVLAETDPVAGAAVLVEAGADAEAADLLARHASAVTPTAALSLLYRMRPEVRRRLPPSLSAARATVEMDGALAEAERRLATAANERERVEAQVAVGAMLVHRGQLSSACTLLEAAVRTGVTSQAVAAAVGWLGLARLWAGDVEGAAAAVAAPGSSLGWWVAAEVALLRDDGSAVGAAAAQLRSSGWPCAADAVAGRQALADGAESAAAGAAARGYAAAMATGGFDVLVAGPVHAWCMARAGRWDEALAVADTLRRRVGPVDTCARLHADLIAESAALAAGDAVGAARAGKAIAAGRRLGFAPVEQAARRWLPAPGGSGVQIVRKPDETNAGTAEALAVAVLGPVEVTVDGARVDDGAWRSRKAREVLVLLALAGEAGLDRDEVVEAVWPDRDPGRGRTSLRTALAEVRRVLEPGRPPGEPSRFVLTRAARIVVRAETDLAAVHRLVRERGPDRRSLVAAWRLFRGPLVADDPYVPSLDAMRPEVERLQLEVADAVVAHAGDGDIPAEVLVAAAAHLVEAEPWRDDVVPRVAAACRAAGEEAAAAQVERLFGTSKGSG